MEHIWNKNDVVDSSRCPCSGPHRSDPPARALDRRQVLARRLVARINAVPHTIYAEPFVGMGGSSSAATSARNAR
jgi:hypothetical protein